MTQVKQRGYNACRGAELLGEDPLNRIDQFVEIIGFGEVVGCPQFHALARDGDIVNTGQDNNRHLAAAFIEEAEDFESVPVRHAEIQQDKIKFLLLKNGHRLVTIRSSLNIESFEREMTLHQRAERFFIINVEQPLSHGQTVPEWCSVSYEEKQ